MTTAARPPTIRLERVSYVYPRSEVRALDEVELEIAPGDVVALVGQNGSGKSTLVRHLNGLLRPTRGEVSFDGDSTRRRTVAELARIVGLVFQDPDRQIFAGSVRAEVEFGPRNVGLSGATLRAAVDEALEAIGLADEAGTNPYDLGGSRRKLLALASVLAMRTPVLVLDEPTTGQDLRGVATVRRVIDQAAAAGRTVIAISHDMEFVAEAFARVVVLREGRLILDGPPASVFAQDRWDSLASTYLEAPLAARLGARLRLDHVTPTDAALLAALASLGAAGPAGDQ
ncbi:MAG TPA: ABC transporter ATP-binding protein [Candidatus Limnocylindria bacterium]|nr:ABC transporter ATP-binding protein [Candidatus Limnocylindria bacterium]